MKYYKSHAIHIFRTHCYCDGEVYHTFHDSLDFSLEKECQFFANHDLDHYQHKKTGTQE